MAVYYFTRRMLKVNMDTKKLHINSVDSEYEVVIGKNLNALELVKKVYDNGKIAVIIDDKVFDLYNKKLTKDLYDENFELYFIVIQSGEKHKNINTIIDIYKKLEDLNMTRSDLIIGFGGGVVGDMAGFVASTYMRGIKFLNMPTTLLAQVDSCIGGKTGIDTSKGKNIIGTFYNPILVIVDTHYLNSLSKNLISDGFAEIIKYGAIYDESLFTFLENADIDDLKNNYIDIIYLSLSIKKHFVEKDSFDKGYRMILNFGHTYAHAIERYYKYERYSHGQAVAIGMVHIIQKGEEEGFTEKGTSQRMIKLLCKYGLETELSPRLDMGSDTKLNNKLNNKFEETIYKKLDKLIVNDKKNYSGTINFIELKKIGQAEIVKKSLN